MKTRRSYALSNTNKSLAVETRKSNNAAVERKSFAMKTRRSTALQKDNDSLSMQSVLFPEPQMRDQNIIVPETPGKYNAINNVVCAASVLETPDDLEHFNKVNQLNKITNDNWKNNKEENDCYLSDESMELDVTPDLNLKKKRGLISKLESEVSFTKSLKTSNLKNSSMLSNFEPRYKMNRNDKLSSYHLNDSKTVDKLSLSKSLKKTRKSILPLKAKVKKKTSESVVCAENMSLETSCPSPIIMKGSRRSTMIRSLLHNSTVLYENNELDFTNPSTGSDVILHCKEFNNNSNLPQRLVSKEKVFVPPLNLSSSSCALTNDSIPQILSFCNFNSNSFDEYRKCHIASRNLPNSSSVSDLNNGHEGEFNNSNLPVFTPEDSLKATQPALCLVLKGVTAQVDVRSGSENRSVPVEDVLLSLGAEVVHKFSIEVSHLVFWNGSKVIYQKALQRGVNIVSSLWVDACKVKGVRVPESLFPVSSDFGKSSVVKRHRKQKSMQPRTFEEDKELFANRMKKKFRNAIFSATSSDSAACPSVSSSSSLNKKRNSRLFGIEHLLTPDRNAKKNLSVSSKSDEDSDSSDSNTPLATRMFNKFMSPQQNFCSPLRKEIRVPLSPLVNNVNSNSISVKHKKKNTSSTENPLRTPTTRKRSSLKLSLSELSLSSSEQSQDNLSQSSENSFENEKEEISETTPKDPSSILKRTDTNSVKRKSRLVVPSENLSPKIVLPKYLPSTSSQSSQMGGSKMRKLHSVASDIVVEDLIVPVTPVSSPSKSTHFPYDNLHVSAASTQRKAIRMINKKDFSNLKAFPLPSKVKRNPVGTIFSTDSENSQSTENPNLKTPKTRFSLIPNKGNSLEEFASPRNSRRRSCCEVKQSPKKSLPSICITSVHSSDMGSIHAIIKSLGGFRIVDDVQKSTTHIVCGSERRTMNVLFAITSGCWVLDVSWLYESVELLKWAPEEPFELFNFCPGSKITRLLKNEGPLPSLFQDLGRIYVHSCSPKIYVMRDLLHKCGAKIVSSIKSADVVISHEKLERCSCVQITEKWAFDSIQQWQVKQFDSYLIC